MTPKRSDSQRGIEILEKWHGELMLKCCMRLLWATILYACSTTAKKSSPWKWRASFRYSAFVERVAVSCVHVPQFFCVERADPAWLIFKVRFHICYLSLSSPWVHLLAISSHAIVVDPALSHFLCYGKVLWLQAPQGRGCGVAHHYWFCVHWS